MMWVVLGLMWLPWAGLVAWLTRQVARGTGVNQVTAEESLRRSYAEGKIDRERFHEMMADLSAGSASAGN